MARTVASVAGDPGVGAGATAIAAGIAEAAGGLRGLARATRGTVYEENPTPEHRKVASPSRR